MTIDNNQLTKMVHVVRDVAAAGRRFATLFGMPAPEVVATSAPAPDDSGVFNWFRGRNIDGRVKLSNLQLGPVAVELIEPVDDESPWAEFLRDQGEGVFSLVFTVKDFGTHIERLKAAGMPIYHHGEYGSGRYAYFESKEQLGVTICIQEINQ